MKDHNPRIVCRDGFSISVQADEFAYCEPRQDVGPYTRVECGYPSTTPISQRLKEFAELCGTDDYCETVYAYVPIEIVQEELNLHGGIIEGKFPD